jgi:cytochrome c556
VRRPSSVGVAGAAIVAALLTAAAIAEAQRRGGRDNAAQGLPVATNTILANPDAYYGKLVTVSAGVDAMLSKTVFLVDQWKALGTEEAVPMGKPILVIAPYLSASLEHRQYFLLRGQVVKFDPAAIGAAASGYALDLPPDMQAKYLGQPVLVATSVVNTPSVELGRKPLMPEEIAMTAVMKTIAPAFAALRTAADAAKVAEVSQNTAKLVPAFSQTEAIWDGLGQSPAAQWARDARAHAAAIDRAAAAGNWDAVKTSAAELNQTCQNCHGAYRERTDDGTFRFKAGTY